MRRLLIPWHRDVGCPVMLVGLRQGSRPALCKEVLFCDGGEMFLPTLREVRMTNKCTLLSSGLSPRLVRHPASRLPYSAVREVVAYRLAAGFEPKQRPLVW